MTTQIARVPLLDEQGRFPDRFQPAAVATAVTDAQQAAGQSQTALAQANEIVTTMVVGGTVTGDHLILTLHDGSTVDAGVVRGQKGDQGDIGPAGLTWRGIWDADTDYQQDDAVQYEGASWVAAQDPPAREIPSTASTVWMQLALAGAKGDQGDKGDQGKDSTVPGPANVLAVGTVTTLDPGTQALVTITGSSPSQILNFSIPRGFDGQPNSLSVGGVQTLDPDSPATATITGTAPNQTLNLSIPRGATGATGPASPTQIMGSGRPDIAASMTPAVQAQVAAAPVGSTFSSTNGLLGAWLWVKKSSGWDVASGTSPVWNVASLLNPATFGTMIDAWVWRTSDDVHLYLRGQLISGTTGITVFSTPLPAGLRPLVAYMGIAICEASSKMTCLPLFTSAGQIALWGPVAAGNFEMFLKAPSQPGWPVAAPA